MLKYNFKHKSGIRRTFTTSENTITWESSKRRKDCPRSIIIKRAPFALVSEVVVCKSSTKQFFQKILHKSQQHTCAGFSISLKLQAYSCNFIKKWALVRVFFCEIFETFKVSFFKEAFRWNAFVSCNQNRRGQSQEVKVLQSNWKIPVKAPILGVWPGLENQPCSLSFLGQNQNDNIAI